jgi:hypothetical protein
MVPEVETVLPGEISYNVVVSIMTDNCEVGMLAIDDGTGLFGNDDGTELNVTKVVEVPDNGVATDPIDENGIDDGMALNSITTTLYDETR